MFKDEQPLFTDDCLGIQETIAIRHHLGNHNWRVLSVFSSGAIIQELNEPGLMGFFKRLFVRTKYLLLLRSGKESEILDYYDLNSVQERVLKILKDKDCFDDADASFFQTLANPEKIAREFCEARLNSAITSEADIESKIASYIDEYNSLIAIIERNNLKIAAEPFIRRVLLDAGLLLPSTISDNSKRLLSLLKFSQKDIDLFVSRQFELRLRSKPVKGFKEAYKILSSLFEDLVVSLEQIFQREHIKLRSLSKVLEDYLIPICSPESLIELQRTLSERQGDKSPFLNLINEVFLEAYSENLINRFKVMFSGKAATIEDVLQIEEPNKNAGETYKYFVSADSKQFEFGHEKSPLLIRILEPGFELEFSTSGVSYKKQGSCRLIPYSDIRFYVKKLELTQIALDKLGSHPTGQKRWMYLKKDLTKNLRYKYNPLLDIYEYFYVLIAYEDDVLISLLFDIDYETGERKIKELVKRLRALHYFENKKDFSNYETSERDKERTPQVDRTLKPVTSEEEQESPFRPLPTCPVEADLSQEKEDKLVLREESGESHSTIVESEADPVENGTAVKHIEEEPSANLSYDEDIEIERRSKALLDHYNLISSEKLTVDDIAGLSFHAVLTLLLFELSSNGFPDEILHNVALFSKAIVDNEKDAFASLIDKVYDKALVSDSSVMLIHISKEVEELLHAFPIDNDLMSSIIKNEAMFLVLEQDIVGAETNFAEEIAVKLEKVAQQLELFFARDIQVREALMKDVLDHFRATLSGTELYLFLRNTGFYSLKGWMIEAIKQYMEGQDLQLPSDDLKNSSKGEPETKIDDTSYPAIELKRQLSCVEIGKDGKQVLIGTKDRTLEIVDLENNDKSRVLRNGLVAPISCIEAIDDIIVTGHQNGDIDFWDCKIGRLVNRIRLSRSKVIYFSYKMKELIAASEDGSINLYCFATDTLEDNPVLRPITDSVRFTALTMDWNLSRKIVYAANADAVRGYASDGKLIRIIRDSAQTTSMVVKENGDLVFGTQAGIINVYSAKEEKIIKSVEADDIPIGIDLDKDQRHIICVCKGGSIKAFNSDSLRTTGTLNLGHEPIGFFLLLDLSSKLVVGTEEGKIFQVDMNSLNVSLSKEDRTVKNKTDTPETTSETADVMKDRLSTPQIPEQFQTRIDPFAAEPITKPSSEVVQVSSGGEEVVNALGQAIKKNSSPEIEAMLKRVFALESNKKHLLSDLRINQLQLVRMMPLLSYDGRPLIEIIERDQRYLVWGRNYAEEINEKIRETILGMTLEG